MPILNKKFIDALPTPMSGHKITWDTRLAGFGIRVYSSGKRDFIFNYRNKQGRSRRYTIGQVGTFTVDEARKEAYRLCAEVERGGDPAEKDKIARESDTIAQLCEQYMERHSKQFKKPRSIESDQYLIERFIKPNFGARKVTEITSRDVCDIHFRLRDTPYQANRVVEVLSKMFNLAETWGIRERNTNPVPRNIKYREKKRERFLSFEEIGKLNCELERSTLARVEHQSVICAYRLLLLTGCRLSEIQTLKWEYINFENATIHLPDSKTGARDIELNPAAMDILRKHPPKDSNPYVIWSDKTDNYWNDLQNPWQRIRRRAGLEDVRIHDLRHTFASVAIGLGESLTMVGKLLGHTQAQTTMRYAHLSKKVVKESASKVGNAFSNIMNPIQGDNIIQFHAG